MQNLIIIISMCFISFVLNACGSSSHNNTTPQETGHTSTQITLQQGASPDATSIENPLAQNTTTPSNSIQLIGHIQKGPFLKDTPVIIRELDDQLIPTGKFFQTEILSLLGDFETSIKLTSNLVEVSSLGHYFHEMTNQTSESPLQLSALAKLSHDSNQHVINVNLFTHLTQSRIRKLILSGLSFDESLQQTESELLTALPIIDPGKIRYQLNQLNLLRAEPENGSLLAMSMMFQQATNTTQELSSLIKTFINDFSEDGTIENKNLTSQLNQSYQNIPFDKVISNLSVRYASVDPSFELPQLSHLPNRAPVAHAGFDKVIAVGDTDSLNGSGSYDIDQDDIKYNWALTQTPTGSQATLEAANTVYPKFTADIAGDYLISLIVNDGLLNSNHDEVLISTKNRPPVLQVDDTFVPFGTQIITLDASQSKDPDQDELTYEWWSVTESIVKPRPFSSDEPYISYKPLSKKAETAVYTVKFDEIKQDIISNQVKFYAVIRDTKGLETSQLVRVSFHPAGFIDNGNGTVTDAQGRMWQQRDDGLIYDSVGDYYSRHDPEGKVPRPSVSEFCRDLSLAGFTDWKLPSPNALEYLLDYRFEEPLINPKFFPDTKPSYYTASAFYPIFQLALVDFAKGFRQLRLHEDTSKIIQGNEGYTRCVRDVKSFSILGLPDFATLQNNGDDTALITITPDIEDIGSYPMTVTLSDNSINVSETFTLTVKEALPLKNDSPKLEPIDDQTVNEGDSLTLMFSATDKQGDILAFSAPNLPVFATLTDHGNGTASMILTPDHADRGIHQLNIAVSDGFYKTDRVFTVKINDQTPKNQAIPIISDFAAGHEHTCMIVSNKVHCWGENLDDQLTIPEGLINPTAISALGDRTCVIAQDGVHCWGRNHIRQTSVPTDLVNPYAITVGFWHSCALTDNGIQCWGDNQYGQVDVPSALSKVTEIAAGAHHTCVLNDDHVHCWGLNKQGQLDVPVLQNPSMITAGESHNCALTDQGVLCWGNNYHGQIDVPDDLLNPHAIAASKSHSCALTDTGVRCWGSDEYGQSTVPTDLNKPKAIALGAWHSCALTNNGLRCWGKNRYGQLTNVLPLKNPKRIVTGGEHYCALDNNGLVCWGDNYYGQIEVPADLTYPVKTIALSLHHSCALSSTKIQCWGRDEDGQVSDVPKNLSQVTLGRSDAISLLPFGDQIVNAGSSSTIRLNYPDANGDGLVSIDDIGVGYAHSCALTEAGMVCWGNNKYGQADVPDDLKRIQAIAVGKFHNCVLINSAHVKCWGLNTSGQTDVPNDLVNPSVIAAGGTMSCALTENGVRCWGGENSEQNTIPADLLNPSDIGIGNRHICVLTDTGVRCWGNNDKGQTDVPEGLLNPRSLSVGYTVSCVLTDEGVSCWGKR